MAACAAGKQPWLGGTCNIYFCRVRNFEEQTSRGQGWATKWDLSEDRQIASQEYRIAEVPEKGSWNVQVVCLGHHQLALHWIYYPCRVFSFHKTNWLQQLLQVSSLVRLNLPTDTFPSLVWFPACLTHPLVHTSSVFPGHWYFLQSKCFSCGSAHVNTTFFSCKPRFVTQLNWLILLGQCLIHLCVTST